MAQVTFSGTTISDNNGNNFDFAQGVMFDGQLLHDPKGDQINISSDEWEGFATVGEIRIFGGTAPVSWIQCDGHVMTDEEKEQYPELAKKLENVDLSQTKYPLGDQSYAVARYLFNYSVRDLFCEYNFEAYNVEYPVGLYGRCAKLNGTNAYIDMNMSRNLNI